MGAGGSSYYFLYILGFFMIKNLVSTVAKAIKLIIKGYGTPERAEFKK